MEIQSRNIAVCIVLSIVTFGIYAIYWFIKLNNELNELANVPNPTSGGLAVLLSIVTCGIYGFYWAYKQGEKVDSARVSRGMESGSSGILYLILQIVGLGLIGYALMQNEINHLVQ